MGEGHTWYEMLYRAAGRRGTQGSGHQRREQSELLLRLEPEALGPTLARKSSGQPLDREWKHMIWKEN